MNKIRKAVGNHPLVSTINKLIDAVESKTLLDDETVQVTRGDNGQRVHVKDRSVQPINNFLIQFQLKKIHDDYLECVSWDGTNAGTATINIAKPHGLRKTPWDTKTVDGITYSFPGPDSTYRDATPPLEHQRITPYYVEGFSVIMATVVKDMAVKSDDGMYMIMLDANNDGRAWAKVS